MHGSPADVPVPISETTPTVEDTTNYEAFLNVMRSWIGIVILFIWTFCTFFHLCNGLRHLFWDAGKGFGLRSIYLSGWSVVLISMALTIAVWITGALTMGGMR